MGIHKHETLRFVNTELLFTSLLVLKTLEFSLTFSLFFHIISNPGRHIFISNIKIHIELYFMIPVLPYTPKPPSFLAFSYLFFFFCSYFTIAYSLQSTLKDVFETYARSCYISLRFLQCPSITLK